MTMLDRRLNAYRPDLADERLTGQVEAARFTAGAPMQVSASVVDLRAELGIPPTLSALGIDRADFRRIAEMSLSDPTAAVNPRPYTLDGAIAILDAAA